MRVARENFLKVLESVTPGLASRETVEQSSCIVFDKGRVITFNDSVACSRESPINIQGAVKAKPILDLLSKMNEDDIEIRIDGDSMMIEGVRRKAKLRMEHDVTLPISSVETPDTWRKLDPDFSEAIGIVHSCASTEESQFELTCIHIHPNFVEACDRFQIARFPLATGVANSILVKAESIKKIIGFDMTEVCETDSWIHFRNPAGLVLSCRRYLDQYKDLSRFLSPEGTEPATLPGGLEEVVKRAEVFSIDNAAGNHLIIELKADRVMIQGEGTTGWYREMKEAKYSGPPTRFIISPKLINEVVKKTSDVRIGDGRVFVDGGKFKFSAVTDVPSEKPVETKEG